MRATSSTGEVIYLFLVGFIVTPLSYSCVYLDLIEQDRSKEDTGSVILACTDTEGMRSRISPVQETFTLTLLMYMIKRSCFCVRHNDIWARGMTPGSGEHQERTTGEYQISSSPSSTPWRHKAFCQRRPVPFPAASNPPCWWKRVVVVISGINWKPKFTDPLTQSPLTFSFLLFSMTFVPCTFLPSELAMVIVAPCY